MSAENDERRPDGGGVHTAATRVTALDFHRTVTIWRVRWRGPSWGTATETRSRLFYHRANALKFARSRADAGLDVEISRASPRVEFEAVVELEARGTG